MSYCKMAKKLAKELGIILEVGGGGQFEVTAEAPEGFEFVSDPGLSCIVSSAWDDESCEDIWKDMYERISMGLCIKNEF